jgi:ubiquinone/menaquinone biosynthesis C-methylase UbiE
VSDRPTTIKQDMRSFYASEAADRSGEDWIRLGGTARVPESRTSHYFIDRKVETALALAALPATSRVLEVGSSFGHMSFLLAERFREVVATDLSPESIDLARRRASHYGVSNLRFEVADAEALTAFRDGEFDGVFAFSTLRFCPDPDRALREMHRMVRPGGAVVVDVPNRDCPWYGPMKQVFRIEPHVHDRLYTEMEIVAALRKAGLESIASRHILFTTKRVPDGLLPAFKLLDRVLEPIPGLRGWSGIVMARGVKVVRD